MIGNSSDPFSRYYAEILRAEGLNEFNVTDLANVDASTLDSYDVVVLGQTALSGAQAQMLTDWVTGGGNLIAMRPDSRLADLLGLTAAGSPLSEGYIKVDTGSGPGAGIVGDTMQFHGAADRLHGDRRRHRRVALLRCDDADRQPGGDAAERRVQRRPGGRIHVRPRALDRLHASGQPGLGGTIARRRVRTDPLRQPLLRRMPPTTHNPTGSIATRSPSLRPTSSSGCWPT